MFKKYDVRQKKKLFYTHRLKMMISLVSMFRPFDCLLYNSFSRVLLLNNFLKRKNETTLVHR